MVLVFIAHESVGHCGARSTRTDVVVQGQVCGAIEVIESVAFSRRKRLINCTAFGKRTLTHITKMTHETFWNIEPWSGRVLEYHHVCGTGVRAP